MSTGGYNRIRKLGNTSSTPQGEGCRPMVFWKKKFGNKGQLERKTKKGQIQKQLKLKGESKRRMGKNRGGKGARHVQ
jgi:hypothetical protein